MSELELTSPGYADVNTCHATVEGQGLLHALGLKTNTLNPKLYFVPWITIDGVRDCHAFYIDLYSRGEMWLTATCTCTAAPDLVIGQLRISAHPEYRMFAWDLTSAFFQF